MQVNFLGVVRVCRAFLPALRRSAGAAPAPACAPRVVIVSSMSGKIPCPLLAPYTTSKHAVAAYAGISHDGRASRRLSFAALC